MPGIYVHIPFRRSGRWDRDEYYIIDEGPFDSFLDALLIEVDIYGARYGGEAAVDTVYIGGGTPSLLSPPEIGRILAGIRRAFTVEERAETTIEADPGDLSREYLRSLQSLGVNRISTAVESFFEQDLDRLGAGHSPQQARAALLLLPQMGFTNYNIDLLFDIPDQPLEYWQANLERALRHETPHVTTYQAGPTESDDDSGDGTADPAAAYRFAMEYLPEGGYEQYEISHFARPGFASRHLQRYWSHENYIGLGPSAHSFWREPGEAVYRWSNTDNFAIYRDLLAQREVPLDARERVSRTMLANEYIMLRLQTGKGLDLNVLKQRYAVDLTASRAEELHALQQERFITRARPENVRLTDEGKLRHEAVTSRLLISKDHLMIS